MGQYEEAASEVRRARLERREQASFDREPHRSKIADDGGRAEIDVTFDVFEEAPFRLTVLDDPPDVGPEMARIVFALPFARERERLAGIAASDEMNFLAPRSAVEGGDIVPDRSLIHGLVRHPCHEGRCRVGFPLDETNSSIAGFCDMDTELQSANAGAERDPAQFLMFSGM